MVFDIVIWVLLGVLFSTEATATLVLKHPAISNNNADKQINNYDRGHRGLLQNGISM